MKTVVPSYYKDFSCIADRCKHNCCIGWEIDVDSKSCAYYSAVTGGFGDKLRANIDFDDEQPHFILSDDERCPFLNNKNLCDIIINLGEDRLCEICSEHPRFKNFYTSRIECGIGLCCEAAAQLILNYTDKVEFVTLEDDVEMPVEEEQEIFFFRQKVLNIIQDRSFSINERISKIIDDFDAFYPDYSLAEWSDVFLDLEHLDAQWPDMLCKLKNSGNVEGDFPDIVLEQLFVYFIYRHFADAIYDGRCSERIAFAVVGVQMISAIAKACDMDIIDVARFYSSEIEYSEDNTECLLNIL